MFVQNPLDDVIRQTSAFHHFAGWGFALKFEKYQCFIDNLIEFTIYPILHTTSDLTFDNLTFLLA
jgi:hypothetical protein